VQQVLHKKATTNCVHGGSDGLAGQRSQPDLPSTLLEVMLPRADRRRMQVVHTFV